MGESQKLLRLELELTQRGKLDMSDPHELPADRLPIVLRDVDFKYHIGEDETSLHTVQKLNANFRQGHLICLTGPPKQGKSTILRLLGESILPDEVKENLVFVPPHVRVVTVPEHPVVLGPEETIFENLCYGLAIDQTELKNDKDTNAALMARARNILALLGCDKSCSRVPPQPGAAAYAQADGAPGAGTREIGVVGDETIRGGPRFTRGPEARRSESAAAASHHYLHGGVSEGGPRFCRRGVRCRRRHAEETQEHETHRECDFVATERQWLIHG